MAQPRRIDVSHFIDDRPISRFQFAVVVMALAVLVSEGIDLQIIGFVAPSIAEGLHIPATELGPIFSAGLFGMTLGGLVCGPVADRFGRRPLTILSVALFGAFTLISATATSGSELLAYRFLAGIGLGGGMPNMGSLVAEFTPPRRRKSLLSITSLGITGGATLSGLLVSAILPAHGWQGVFVATGGLPLAIAAVLWFVLPESLRFLATRGGHDRAVAAIMAKIDPAIPADASFYSSEPVQHGVPIRHLFTQGRLPFTIAFWFCAFMVLMALYFTSNWLPVLIHRSGIPIATTIAIVTLFHFGTAVGSVTIGCLMEFVEPYLVLTVVAVLATVSVALLGTAGGDANLLMIVGFIGGFCVVGTQGGLNTIVVTSYPTFMRTTGYGWMLSIGRFGSIISPLVGGALLARHWSMASLFDAAAVPVALATLAALYLMIHGRRHPGVFETA